MPGAPAAVHVSLDLHRLAGAELLVLHALREHAAARPAPHFASDGVDDDEVVALSVREFELDVLVADVRDVEREAHRDARDVDVELRDEFDFGRVALASRVDALAYARRCCATVTGAAVRSATGASECERGPQANATAPAQSNVMINRVFMSRG